MLSRESRFSFFQSNTALALNRFICSANNNISRISKMVQNLCTHFSPPLVTINALEVDQQIAKKDSRTYHPFPPPSALAHPSVAAKLRELGFGYRAEYIQKTASMLIESHLSDEGVYTWLDSLRRMDTEASRMELLKLMGIGRKVADCVLLMSMDKVCAPHAVLDIRLHVYECGEM